MSANQTTLKAALLDFLKNDALKQPAITLDCNWSHSLKLSDQKNYYFISKSLKKQLKDDGKIPEDKNFRITLSKWNFVVEGTKKGIKEVDLDVKKYSIKPIKEEIDFSKRTKDLLEYPDVKSKLEIDNKGSEKKTSIKKTKTKANEKVKEAHAEPKLSKKAEKDTSVKHKIDKSNNSGRSSIVKTLKSKKTTNKNTDNGDSVKLNGNEGKKSAVTTDISFIDVIKAKEFEGLYTQRSATKVLRFQSSHTGVSRVASPHQVNQESLHRLSSALGKAVAEQHSFENVLPDSLKNQGLSYKEYLVGRDKGLVSAKEITFNRNVVDMFLRDYEKKAKDSHN